MEASLPLVARDRFGQWWDEQGGDLPHRWLRRGGNVLLTDEQLVELNGPVDFYALDYLTRKAAPFKVEQ